MTKKIRNEDDRINSLEREVRELKSLNRSLQKRLRKLDKGGSKSEKREKSKQLYEESIEYEEEVEQTFNCPKCSRGNLQKVSVAERSFFRCVICEYRTKAEKKP